MKRAVALLTYSVGTLLAVYSLITGFTKDSPQEWLVGLGLALALWWITAGIALRLGVAPSEFGSLVLSSLGFHRENDSDNRGGPQKF